MLRERLNLSLIHICAVPLLTIDEGGEDSSRFTVVSPVFLDTKIEGIRYGLVDESTRLNLEAALAWENETPGAGRNALMKMPGMTATAADSILDWICLLYTSERASQRTISLQGLDGSRRPQLSVGYSIWVLRSCRLLVAGVVRLCLRAARRQLSLIHI